MTTSTLTLWIAMSLISNVSVTAQADMYVFNGSFEQDSYADGVPDGWAAYGRAGVEQQLNAVADPQRGRVVRRDCRRARFEMGQ